MFQLSDHYLCTGGELSSSARAIHPGETPTRKRLCGATSRPRDRPVKLPLNSIMMKRGSFTPPATWCNSGVQVCGPILEPRGAGLSSG